MSETIHDTFRIKRTYPATPERVFAAFTTKEAKEIWGDTGDLSPVGGETGGETGGEAGADTDSTSESEFDFRAGGRERFSFGYNGIAYRYDALYYDIVPAQRIIYSYEMYANDARISVSVATIEFAAAGDGTALTVTEQGTYLDGFDGPDAPRLRQEGVTEMLDNLTDYLKQQA